MNLMPLAWSFPAWKCRACGCVVEWDDAIAVDTPELFAVFHKSCESRSGVGVDGKPTT